MTNTYSLCIIYLENDPRAKKPQPDHRARMKFAQFLLNCLIFVTIANAEAFHYSSGWSPGQTSSSVNPTASPQAQNPSSQQFSWSSFLTSGPIATFFAKSGVNMTERLAEAQRKAELPWDDRIPMIRDDNFEELIFNESFATPEEDEVRIWFLVVTITSNQRSGISAVVDQEFNEAYEISLKDQDLPHVRWGRIDYLNVTRLTTKWGVWRAPIYIVAKHRGKTLRYFHPQQLGGVKASFIRTFLMDELWTLREPWTGPWAPGGSREELLDKFAILSEKIYFYMSKIPRWMYLILSGTLGSVLLNVFHRKPKATISSTDQSSAIAPAAVVEKPDDGATGNKTERAQKRKGIKK
ncbi:hypothetical protein K439DRAFT_1625932 [Ramaria rubella]|nr:hypothetical protein K439DRAFT_1625932 [Ramaria rubella]